jgi:hypothetical protein
MKTKLHLTIVSIVLLTAGTLFLTSCGDDLIKGCTDEAAENYNPDAEESDGNCTFSREKFVGDYLGSIVCPGDLSDSFNPDTTYAFKIVEDLDIDAGPNDLKISLPISTTINGFPINTQITFGGTADGNRLLVDNDVIMIATLSVIVSADITMQSDNKTISGSLDIDASTFLGADMCMLSGVKQ